ncbi:Protein CBG27415 [Caenorhabditis briggsae]|nr:Protein CBG27415 [Caenorhabditis briggsae]CAS00222.1 Protein CBG27415 [Caenorhabditis briggsae]
MTPEDEEPAQLSTERDQATVTRESHAAVSEASETFETLASTQEGTRETSSRMNDPISSLNQARDSDQIQTSPRPNLLDARSNAAELSNSAKNSCPEVSGASTDDQSPDDVPAPDLVPLCSSDCVQSPVSCQNDRLPVPPPPPRNQTADELKAFYAARNREYERHKRSTGYESSSSEDGWIEKGHSQRSRKNGRQISNEGDVVEQSTMSNQPNAYAEIDAQDVVDPARHLEDVGGDDPDNRVMRANQNEGPDQQIESGRAEDDDSDEVDEEDEESDAETFEAITSDSPQEYNPEVLSLVNRPISASHQTSASGQTEADFQPIILRDPSNATELPNSAISPTLEIAKASTEGQYKDVPGPDLVFTRSSDCAQSPVSCRKDRVPVPASARRNQTAEELKDFYKARNREYEQHKTTTGYESSSSEDDWIEKGPSQRSRERQTPNESDVVERSETNNEMDAYAEIDAHDDGNEPSRHLEDVEEEVPVNWVTRADQNEEAKIEIEDAEDDDLDKDDKEDGESDADIPTTSQLEETRKRPATMGPSGSTASKKSNSETNHQDEEIGRTLESAKPKRKRKSQKNYFSSMERKRHQAASQRYKSIKETENKSSTAVSSSSIQEEYPAAHAHGEVQLQVRVHLSPAVGHLENEEDDLLASGPIVLLPTGSSQELPPQGMRYRQSHSSPSVPFGVQRAGQHGINNGALERNFRDYHIGEDAAGPSTSAEATANYTDCDTSNGQPGIGQEPRVFPVDRPAANFAEIGAIDQI